MMKVDPEFAVKTAVEALETAVSIATLWPYAEVPMAFGNWAWKDTEAAWAWMKEQEQTGILKPYRVGPAQFPADELKAQLLWTLIMRKHAATDAFIEGLKEPVGRGLEAILDRSLRLIPPAGSEPGAGDHAWAEVYLEVIRKQVSKGNRAPLYQAMVSRFQPEQPGSLENLGSLFQNPAITPEELVALAREVIVWRSGMQRFPADPEADRRTAEETRVWLNLVLPEGEAHDLFVDVARERREGERQRARYLLEGIRLSGFPEEVRAQQLREGDFGTATEEAIGVAKTFQDQELRDQTIRHLRMKANPEATDE
jgi:hypothetical protein